MVARKAKRSTIAGFTAVITGLLVPAGFSHAGEPVADRTDDAAAAASRRRLRPTRRDAVVMPRVANGTRAFGPDSCAVPTATVPADPAATTVPPSPCVVEPTTTAPTTTVPPDTTVPTPDTSVPTTDTSLPADTSVPATDTSLPADATTTAPPADTTVPATTTTVPPVDTTLPATTVPPLDTTTTVPPSDTTTAPPTVPPPDATTTVPPPDTTPPTSTVPPPDTTPPTTVPPPDTTPPTTAPSTDPPTTTTIPLPAPEPVPTPPPAPAPEPFPQPAPDPSPAPAPEPNPAPLPEPPGGVEAPIHDSSRPPLITVDPARQPQADAALGVLPEPALVLPDPATAPDPAAAPDPATTQPPAADPAAAPAADSQPATDATVPPAPDAAAAPAEAPVDPAGDQSPDDGHDHSTDTRVGPKAPLPTTGVVADGVPVAVVLETIRTFESNSRYDAAPNAAGASGAYQYIPSTWAGYGGYAEAYLAPPEVQDARADADVEAILATYGEVSMVPIAWYFPLAVTDPSWMDRVPNPTGGNTLTVRQYQSEWLDVYVEKLTAYAPVPSLPDSRAGDVRSIAFPVLGPVTYSNDWGACRDDCTRHHEGNDIIGVRMQPLLAVTDGVVSRVRYENAGKAGAIITVTDADGWSYNYFHVNNDTPGSDDGAAGPEWQVSPYIRVGSPVAAGEIIGYMGDSGNSEGSVPHLHFEIRRPDGTPVNPHPSLIAAQQRQQCSIGIGPWSTNVSDDADPAAPGVTITPLFGEGAWYIDAVGRVTATGDAALIRPGRSNPCPPGPSTPFGTGGGAAAVPPGGLPVMPAEAPAVPDAAAVEVTDPTTGIVHVVTTLSVPADPAVAERLLGIAIGRIDRGRVTVRAAGAPR